MSTRDSFDDRVHRGGARRDAGEDPLDPDLFDAALTPEELAEQRAVRALLSSLPDPGPVPPDVVDRITATLQALQAERDREEAIAQGAPEPVLAGATAVPLRRRAPQRLLWLAAAAAVVLTGGGAVVSRLASDTSPGQSAASVATRSAGAGGAQGGSVYASGTDYRRADLIAQAQALLAQQSAPPAQDQSSRNAGGEGQASGESAPAPLLPSVTMRACLRALGMSPDDLLAADRATYEGRPVLVLVVRAATERLVRVVGRDCEAGATSTVTTVPLP